jgi:3D (Asp-Asp-Asp) domain-containing protein
MACGSSSSSISGDRDGGPPADGMILPLRDAAEADDVVQADSSRGDLDVTPPPVDGSVDRGAGDADLAVDAVDAAAGNTLSVYVTFYGWADNSPPGGAIAYPKKGGFPTVHDLAGGTGTLADPVTFATDKAEFPAGTILYVPFIEKYVVMEDDCAECDSDWTGSQKRHIDVWMNSNAAEDMNALIQCEDAWTRTTTSIEVNPPAGRLVTTAPLFDPSTNVCRTSP